MQVDTEGKALLRPCSLPQLLVYFAKLGAFGFGGPIALTGAMQRDLVERERWISLQEYKEGLALSQLAPGPLAAQLAIYLGWTRFGVLGATLVAFAFILPSLLMVLGLSALYLGTEVSLGCKVFSMASTLRSSPSLPEAPGSWRKAHSGRSA